MNSTSKRWMIPVLALLGLAVGAAASFAAQTTDTVEARTERESNGAGIRAGVWAVQDLPNGSGATQTPAFEGYFQKGLDMHLVWENTIGYWGNTYSVTSVSVLGSTTTKIQTHLIPSITALKIYPVTARTDPFEPFLLGGAGAVFGIVPQSSSGSGSTAGAGSPTFATGLGLRVGGGFDWHWGPAFGLTGGARYEWASFAQHVGPESLYRGPVFNGGLTYRFQYR